jgi:hypothetical protein
MPVTKLVLVSAKDTPTISIRLLPVPTVCDHEAVEAVVEATTT